MKVTFRTVSGESFSVEDVEPSTTSVGDLKARVAQVRSLQASTLKLVSKGKVLADDAATVEAAGITEAGFVVLFVQPAKAAVATPPKPEAVAAPLPTPAAGEGSSMQVSGCDSGGRGTWTVASGL
jgi:hypothetical protein